MTQDTALTTREQGAMTLQDTMTLADIMVKSGFFSDTRQAAQAVVKILKGRELGIGPVESMMGIHIIQGKVTVGADILAAKVKASGRYDYRIVRLDDKGCEIVFYERTPEGWKDIGHSLFLEADARQAGLLDKPIWRQYPRNMYFSRAMTNGVGWYCPDVTGYARVYTPEELGANTDGDGHVIDVPATALNPDPKPPTVGERVLAQPDNGDRPAPAGRGCSVTPKANDAWKRLTAALAAEEAHYQDGNGNPNWMHIRNAAYSLGFPTVTPDNVESVIDALRTHAHEQARAAEIGAGQQEISLYPAETAGLD